MATKTYQQLSDVLNYLAAIHSTDQVQKGSRQERILQKIANKLQPHIKEMNEKYDDTRLTHAYVDGNGVLKLDDKGGYTFTKPALEALKKDLRKLEQQTFEFQEIQINHMDDIKEFPNLAGWVKDFPSDEDEL